jgi:hypothetical protein
MSDPDHPSVAASIVGTDITGEDSAHLRLEVEYGRATATIDIHLVVPAPALSDKRELMQRELGPLIEALQRVAEAPLSVAMHGPSIVEC